MSIENNVKIMNGVLESKLDEIADFIFTRSQENVAKLSDTGELLNSGYIKKGPLMRIIGYSAPHAMYIEYGTHPHMPPVDAIKAWASRKHIVSEKELERVAWAIAMKIKKDGTQPQPFLRPAVTEATVRFKLV